MFDKPIAIFGILCSTAITFVTVLIVSGAFNEATTQFDERLQPIIKDNPTAQTALETGESLSDIEDFSNDMNTAINKPAKGLKSADFTFPAIALIAGAVLILRRLSKP